LVALGIAIILLVISIVFVMNSWRGWASSGFEKALTAVLDETQISQIEKDEINAHVENLMTRFTEKDINLADLGMVMEELAESPVIPAAMVGSIDALYISQSGFDDAEKAQSRVELARYAQGLFDESIDPETIHLVLDPVTTDTPDEDDIQLNLQLDKDGARINALKSADDVSDDELRELIASAKLNADEAGVTDTPKVIDLSDEIGIAIALAIGDDPSLWLPEGVEYVPAPEIEEVVEEDANDSQDEPTDDSTDADSDDGP